MPDLALDLAMACEFETRMMNTICRNSTYYGYINFKVDVANTVSTGIKIEVIVSWDRSCQADLAMPSLDLAMACVPW